jgi:adenylosuccinate synthase
VTKLDVLSEFDRIKVCVAYEYQGERYEVFPPNQTIFNKCEPVFEEFPGWRTDITKCREVEDLPKQARSYLDAVERLVGTPISWASVGPGRDEVVKLADVEA